MITQLIKKDKYLPILFAIAKKFLSLHPSSVLASNPEWVQGYQDNVRKGIWQLIYILLIYLEANLLILQMTKLSKRLYITNCCVICNC